MRPEAYWINRGEDVIGLDVLTEGSNARQAATYQAIAQTVIDLGVTDILDVGCNVAAFYHFLRDIGFKGDYRGIDTNRFALAMAGSWINAQIGSLRSLPFKHQSFECVVIKDVIEHLECAESLREAFRVANRYVILATYLPFTDGEPIIQQHGNGYYLNIYNWQDIASLAWECGFNWLRRSWPEEANGWQDEVVLWERIA